jgi:hypothetical protein
MTAPQTFSIDAIREIEAELCSPTFRGVPIGMTLADFGMMELYLGRGDWSLTTRLRNRLSRIKNTLRPRQVGRSVPALPTGRILVTWLNPNYRLRDLVFPVLHELGPDRSLVLCAAADMPSLVPAGFQAFHWEQMRQYDAAAWRADWRRCWPEWRRRLRALCRKHRLPGGAYDRIAIRMLGATQQVAACLEWLPILRPAAILTESDREKTWSCLVLSARLLGIPTFTLVHGVLNDRAFPFTPVLADKVLCWGEMQRKQFLDEGEDPAKLLIAGCPRMTRELDVTQADARRKLGMPVDKPLVLLGTTMVDDANRREMAEIFCAAIAELDGVSAAVRLHPAESLDTYDPVAERYPDVRFMKNSDATLDETLAAADLVVVPSSGLGSDALVKHRLTIVLDLPTLRAGHGQDLITLASCPCATNARELAGAIRRLLFDENERQRHFAAAERYVAAFCEFFGQQSARRVARLVEEHLAVRGTAPIGQDVPAPSIPLEAK